MIAYIEGRLLEAWGSSCIVGTAGGAGYRLTLPAHSFSLLPRPGARVSFFTYMSVREDAIELFGFDTFEERNTFEILKGINKVGPRTALAILSLFRPGELREIVIQNNLSALTKVPGIGQKTAQHILLELGYKMKNHNIARPAAPSAPGIFADIMAALANLGYGEDECAPVIRGILQEEADLDLASGIRLALKELAKRK